MTNPISDLKEALARARESAEQLIDLGDLAPCGASLDDVFATANAAVEAAEREREALKDRVFLLSIKAAASKESRPFKPPETKTVRERRIAAEAAGWRALSPEQPEERNYVETMPIRFPPTTTKG